MVPEKRWIICKIDLETAFLQAEGLDWVLQVTPPRKAGSSRTLTKLELAGYGLKDSGWLLYRTSFDKLIGRHGETRSKRFSSSITRTKQTSSSNSF